MIVLVYIVILIVKETIYVTNSLDKEFFMARIKQYCGAYIYEIDNRRIKRYCGPYVYEIDGNRIKQYCGPYIAEIQGNRIKQYCGPYLYEIDGYLNSDELMAVIAILFA